MRLHCYGSSSAGNMFTLTSCTGKTLVLDVGVNPKLLFKQVNPSDIEGVFVTHAHGDHAKYVDKFSGYFCGIYAPFSMPMVNTIIDNQEVECGEFKVLSFMLNHDEKCFGYLVSHKELEAPLLYATDTNGIPYMFGHLSVAIVEMNYSVSLLKQNLENGIVERFRAERVLKTHNSLEQAVHFLDNNIESVRMIVPCHLSAENSDIEIFYQLLELHFGNKIAIARSGLDLSLGRSEVFGNYL